MQTQQKIKLSAAVHSPDRSFCYSRSLSGDNRVKSRNLSLPLDAAIRWISKSTFVICTTAVCGLFITFFNFVSLFSSQIKVFYFSIVFRKRKEMTSDRSGRRAWKLFKNKSNVYILLFLFLFSRSQMCCIFLVNTFSQPCDVISLALAAFILK